MKSTTRSCSTRSASTRDPSRAARPTPREERVIAGFEDILSISPRSTDARRFTAKIATYSNGCTPCAGPPARSAPVSCAVGAAGRVGLLSGEFAGRHRRRSQRTMRRCLPSWGLGATTYGLTTLKHVKPSAPAEEIADRTVCKDFARFRPLFARVQKDLKSGARKTRRFQTMAEIKSRRVFSSSAARKPISWSPARNIGQDRGGETRDCA